MHDVKTKRDRKWAIGKSLKERDVFARKKGAIQKDEKKERD